MRQRTLAALNSFAKRVGEECANPNKFAVALSGGPDSTALAHIFVQWHGLNRSVGETFVKQLPKCIIVNHNLRRESEREAEMVVERARAMGLEPILCSLDLKGERISQQQARHGRLRALFEACVREGVKTVLTGHTANDQIETFILRTMRASGIRGLAGIPPVSTLSENNSSLLPSKAAQVKIKTIFDWQADDAISSEAPLPKHGEEVYTFRPFLVGGIEKRSAIHYCSTHGLDFVLDPSNQNMNYTRNAIRHHFDTINTRRNRSESIFHDIGVVQSAVAHAGLEHDKRVSSMLRAAVKQMITKEEELAKGAKMVQVDISELRKHPRLLVEDALLDLIHSMRNPRHILSRKRKPRMKSIEKLYDTLLRGKKCSTHHVHCTPIPKTKGKLYIFECKL